MSLLAAFTFWQWILAVGIIGVCALLILIVLVQQASGGGLVGAFGGGGSGGAFGAKTGDMFTVITVALASIFLLFTVLGNYAFEPLAAVPPPPAATAPVSPVSDGGVPTGAGPPTSIQQPAFEIEPGSVEWVTEPADQSPAESPPASSEGDATATEPDDGSGGPHSSSQDQPGSKD